MMSRSTFALIVGYFSSIWHLLVMFDIFGISKTIDEQFKNDKLSSDEEMDETHYEQMKELFHEYINAVAAVGVFAALAMFIVSILLIVGIKKQRHRYVLPFVCVMTFSLCFYIMHIFFGVSVDEDDKSEHSDLVEIFSCLIYAAVWYPIFKLYKKMRYDHKHPATSCPASSPVNPHYAPFVAQAQPSSTCPEFSHSAKYVHTETKTPTQHCVYPNVSQV